MKKLLVFTAVIALLLVSLVGLTACKDGEEDYNYTYEPTEDYFNIYATLTADGATARAFSFFTAEDQSYWDACSVQLDPAGKDETEPKFNSKDNITIKAASEDPASVVYATTMNEVLKDLIMEGLPSGIRHKAEATGLNPGQKYFYRVGCAEKDTWSNWGYFATDDRDDSFSFYHITDPQSADKEEFDNFKLTLDAAFAFTGIPEFVLSSGDQIENMWEEIEWRMFYESTRGTLDRTSFVPVNGNHELFSYMTAYNFNIPFLNEGNSYYSFEYGNALVVVLDTQGSFSSDPTDSAQLKWLKETLENSDKKWKIVTFHKSLYATGSHSDDTDVLTYKAQLTPVFYEYGVDLVLSGHDHVYARTMPIAGDGTPAGEREYEEETLENGAIKSIYTDANGPIYVINRTVGSKFYGNSKKLNDHLLVTWDQRKVETPVFCKVDVVGGTLTYTAYEHNRETGEITVLDCFTLNK